MPATCSCSGSSPDLAKLGCPGVKSTRTWVWGGLRGTCSPPGAFAGLGEVRGGASSCGGGCARRDTPASGCSGDSRGYGLPNLAQKVWDGLRVLTEGWNRRKRRAGSAATLIGGVVRAELADRAVRWSSGLLDPEVRSVEVLRRYIGGQGGPVLYDGEQLLRKPCTCGGDSRGESRCGRGGDRG